MYYPNEIFSVFLIKSKAGTGGGDKKTAKNGGLVTRWGELFLHAFLSCQHIFKRFFVEFILAFKPFD